MILSPDTLKEFHSAAMDDLRISCLSPTRLKAALALANAISHYQVVAELEGRKERQSADGHGYSGELITNTGNDPAVE